YMFILSPPHSPISAHFPYTTLFRSQVRMRIHKRVPDARLGSQVNHELKALFCKEVIKPFAVGKVDRFKIEVRLLLEQIQPCPLQDRKSTRLNSSHVKISYAVFCLKK